MTRRRTLLAFVLVVVAVFCCFYVFAPVALWVGSVELAVNVSSTDGLLWEVKCEPFQRRELAQWATRNPTSPEMNNSWSYVVKPFKGEPIKVFVPVSGRDSMWGRELSRIQFQWLAVIGLLNDGKSVTKVVEIPDGRVSREVDVVLP
jgi:hypothetical protein